MTQGGKRKSVRPTWPQLAEAKAALRPTRAEISIAAIAHNLGYVKSRCEAQVLAVVKADAYGHGMARVAKGLAGQPGLLGFGVALAEEGLDLRLAGIGGPILVLNGVYGGAHRRVLDADLWPVVYDIDEVRAFAEAADGPFGVHLKVDTGMSRLGVPFYELDAFLDALDGVPNARLDGVMTHLASADVDEDAAGAQTFEQLARFEQAMSAIRARGHAPKWVHAANSAGTLRFPRAQYDMVRTGVVLYGVSPDGQVDAQLKPAMRLRSEVIALRHLRPGDAVGYNGTFVAERPLRLATVPVGYGDGIMRTLSNRGSMLVGGMRCPIVGNVSMDLTTLDVSEVEGVSVGDEVVILGEQGDEVIHAEELAGWAGTIGYEVLTNISRRVPRVYVDG